MSGNLGACDTNYLRSNQVGTGPGTSGSSFVYDVTNTYNYTYNWHFSPTTTPGEYRITANLDDGSQYYIDVCLVPPTP